MESIQFATCSTDNKILIWDLADIPPPSKPVYKHQLPAKPDEDETEEPVFNEKLYEQLIPQWKPHYTVSKVDVQKSKFSIASG